MRKLKKAAIGMVFMAALALSGAPAEALAVDGVGRISIGDLEILAIDDAKGQAGKGLIPDLAQHPEYEAIFERGPLEGVTRTYFFKDGDRAILVDSGWGQGGKNPGKTLEILRAEGVAPEQITDVIMTHMDHDHAGGLLKDGAPAFPNAKLWVSRPEHEAWSGDGMSSRPQAARDAAKKAFEAYKDRLQLFDFGAEIIPGIQAVDASGHTPGHTAWRVKSGSDELLILGDLMHVAPVQLPLPGLSSIYDLDKAKAADARKRLLGQAAENGAVAAGMHFPMISKVLKRDDGGFMMREPR